MPFKGIQSLLLLTLLLASALPLALGGMVFFSLVNQNITEETFEKVAFARDSKSSEIRQYLSFAGRQAENLAQSASVRYSVGDFYGFSYALRQGSSDSSEATETLRGILSRGAIDPQTGQLSSEAQDSMLREVVEYANAHRRFHTGFVEFLEGAEFDNLYLVDRRGQIVYSVLHDPYFGRVLPTDDSRLAKVYARLKTAEPDTVFVDFAFDPTTGQVAAYLAIRVTLYGRSTAALILRLPASGLQELLGASDIMTLVSSNNRVIAASTETGLQLDSLVAVPNNMREPSGINTFQTGLNGATTLSAWSHLQKPYPKWLIVAEVDQDAAFATSFQLRSAFIYIGLIATAALAVIAFALAKFITSPIRKLATAAGAIADGALDHPLPEYDRPFEYAGLSQAVSQMRRSLRDQVELIREKNNELQTHLRQIEDKNTALEEADRMKDQFLANTSHELRTPLNGIIGISETLETGVMGDLESGQRSQLRLISFSARRLSRLVDDLLDIYRIREGRMRLDLQAVDVAQSLRNVMQLAQPLLHEDPVKISIQTPDALLPALADPMRFEQILFNLLSNAIKHSGQSEIVISAEADHDAQPPTINVSIQDHGPGIASDSLERIFHPLEQITATTDRNGRHKGTGLGLTIARNLAALMSGQIVVSSELGQGSIFTLSLPAAKTTDRLLENYSVTALPDTQDAIDDRAAIQDAVHKTDAPRILLVDDEPINLQVLCNVLIPQGYMITKCADGAEAIRSVSNHKPDLIVLDVMMPGMSGLEVAKQLRRHYSLLDLPIILLTARGRTTDMIEGFEVGANDYVVKPFVKDELLSRIRTLLEASRAKTRADENTELRDEIERRIQVEDALRLSQRRMSQMLEALDDGLICVDPRGLVTFVNGAAHQIFAATITVGQTNMSDLLPTDVWQNLTKDDDDTQSQQLDLKGQHWNVQSFDMLPESGAGKAIVVSKLGREQFMTTIRDAVDTSPPHTGPALTKSAATPVVRDAYRERLVQAMTGTLDLWKMITGRGKIDFAETSGIWRVNLDKTSLQTRTLDKYLLIETLPENPRWRDVIKSLNFILAHVKQINPTPEISEQSAALASILDELSEKSVKN